MTACLVTRRYLPLVCMWRAGWKEVDSCVQRELLQCGEGRSDRLQRRSMPRRRRRARGEQVLSFEECGDRCARRVRPGWQSALLFQEGKRECKKSRVACIEEGSFACPAPLSGRFGVYVQVTVHRRKGKEKISAVTTGTLKSGFLWLSGDPICPLLCAFSPFDR